MSMSMAAMRVISVAVIMRVSGVGMHGGSVRRGVLGFKPGWKPRPS